MNQAFSKIWILVIVIIIVFLAGGILAWQYQDWTFYFYNNYLYQWVHPGKPLPPKVVPPGWPQSKSCTKNEDCGIDICQQGRDKCVEIKYICENGMCIFSAKTIELPSPPYRCVEGKCEKEVIEDETANWKTYRDEDFGFEIKYPSDWEFERIIYSHFIPPFERVKFKPINKIYKSPSGGISYVPVGVEAYNIPYGLKVGKEILINNLKFIEIEPEPGRPSHIFIVENPKKTGYIRITNFVRVIIEMKAGITPEEESNYQTIFKQMLSTFRFLE